MLWFLYDDTQAPKSAKTNKRVAKKRKEKQKQIRKETREKHKRNRQACAQLLDAFHAGGCALCGEAERCCLAGHHIDPAAKSFELGQYRSGEIDREAFVAEINKCVCLCLNCHRKVHAGVASLDGLAPNQLRLVV